MSAPIKKLSADDGHSKLSFLFQHFFNPQLWFLLQNKAKSNSSVLQWPDAQSILYDPKEKRVTNIKLNCSLSSHYPLRLHAPSSLTLVLGPDVKAPRYRGAGNNPS